MLSGLFRGPKKQLSPRTPKANREKTTVSSERLVFLRGFMKGLTAKGVPIAFKHPELLELAFHHRSFSNEHGADPHNNERLEFLGDSVLGLCTATVLYQTLGNCSEGELSKIKSVVVSEPTLAAIAVEIGVDRCLVLGNGEEHSGGRSKKAILADAVEAIIGAYYLDSGFAAADALVRALMVPEINKVLNHQTVRDYKSLLQEYYQKQAKENPWYELVADSGPDHSRTFTIAVHLGSDTFGPETGKSKKAAEQAAAQKACRQLGLSGGA
jgi:ribonuclease-3